jgi:hypothetical protein
MSGFAGPRSQPWVGMAGADTPSQPDARDADAPSNASAISFGFAATAVLVSLFLLMAIFEHLIKPGLASSSSQGSHDEDDGNGEGSGRGLPLARRHPGDGSPPDKLRHSPKVRFFLTDRRIGTVVSSHPSGVSPCARLTCLVSEETTCRLVAFSPAATVHVSLLLCLCRVQTTDRALAMRARPERLFCFLALPL